MAVLLGGRAAEHVVFSHLSTGAADDLAKVTDIARDMVTRYGMAAELGPVSLAESRPGFLGGVPQAPWHEREYSEETAREVDCAVRQIVERVFKRAVDVLERNRATLERGARLLLEKETLTELELRELRLEAQQGA
jgi:cell division protease FtsH